MQEVFPCMYVWIYVVKPRIFFIQFAFIIRKQLYKLCLQKPGARWENLIAFFKKTAGNFHDNYKNTKAIQQQESTKNRYLQHNFCQTDYVTRTDISECCIIKSFSQSERMCKKVLYDPGRCKKFQEKMELLSKLVLLTSAWFRSYQNVVLKAKFGFLFIFMLIEHTYNIYIYYSWSTLLLSSWLPLGRVPPLGLPSRVSN